MSARRKLISFRRKHSMMPADQNRRSIRERSLGILLPPGGRFGAIVTGCPEDMEQVSGGGILDSISECAQSVGFAWDIFLCQKLKTHDYVWRGEYGEPVKKIFTIRYKILRCSRCGKAITGSEYKWVGPNG